MNTYKCRNVPVSKIGSATNRWQCTKSQRIKEIAFWLEWRHKYLEGKNQQLCSFQKNLLKLTQPLGGKKYRVKLEGELSTEKKKLRDQGHHSHVSGWVCVCVNIRERCVHSVVPFFHPITRIYQLSLPLALKLIGLTISTHLFEVQK